MIHNSDAQSEFWEGGELLEVAEKDGSGSGGVGDVHEKMSGGRYESKVNSEDLQFFWQKNLPWQMN